MAAAQLVFVLEYLNASRNRDTKANWEIYDNFGPCYLVMDPAHLEVVSAVNEITVYLNVQAHLDSSQTLVALHILKTIGGRQLAEYFSSLYVIKTALNLRLLRKIRSGSVRTRRTKTAFEP